MGLRSDTDIIVVAISGFKQKKTNLNSYKPSVEYKAGWPELEYHCNLKKYWNACRDFVYNFPYVFLLLNLTVKLSTRILMIF